MKQYGMVFRMNDRIFLGKYDANGEMDCAEDIDDSKGIYTSLGDDELSLVEFTSYQQDVSLKDLRKITIDRTVQDLMEEGCGIELARQLYRAILMGNYCSYFNEQ